MERQLYKIAGALGMNYTELQMKNLVDPEDSDLFAGHPIGNPGPRTACVGPWHCGRTGQT